MTKARWVVVFTLVAAGVVPAWGQVGGQAAAPAPPPMPKPNAALAQLNYFAGVWHCTGTGYTEGKGHPVVSTATLRWQLNDYFLGVRYEEQKTAENPMPVVDEEHWGYGEESKRFIAGAVDNMGGYGTKATSGWNGANFVWLGEYHIMGTTMPFRDSFTKQGDDEVADTGEVRMNGAWAKQFELVCHRQGTR